MASLRRCRLQLISTTSLTEWAYPAVARMLGVSTVPEDILASDPYASSRAFLDVAPSAGLEPFLVPLPVDWNYARGESTAATNRT